MRLRRIAHKGLRRLYEEDSSKGLGADSVDEQPLSLEDALTAYIGRQGKKSLLNTIGDAP